MKLTQWEKIKACPERYARYFSRIQARHARDMADPVKHAALKVKWRLKDAQVRMDPAKKAQRLKYLRKRYKKPEIRARARKRYEDHKERRKAGFRAYYLKNREDILARHKENYDDRKLSKRMGISFHCDQCKKTETDHPTGLCKNCRLTECKKCKKSLIQGYIGQRVHNKCLPRDEGGIAI